VPGGTADSSRDNGGAADSSPEASALSAAVRAAEASLLSEREFAEGLGEELGLVQGRLASLQQEHSSLKRDHTLLSERTAMSEDGLEAARCAAEEGAAAAEATMVELRAELAQVVARLRELQADAAAAAAAKAVARKMSAGGGAAGSVPVTPAKRAAANAAGGGGGGGGGALIEAQARESALTQELAAVRAKLESLLALGAASASDALAQLDTGPGPDTHSVHALLGVLRCSLLLHGSPQGEGDPGASLSSVQRLQAQLEHVLQAALSGGDDNGASDGDGDAPCVPGLLSELRALRELQAECGPDHTSVAPPRPGSMGEPSPAPRGGGDLKAKLAAAAAEAAHADAHGRAQMGAAEMAGGGGGAGGDVGWGGWGEDDGNGGDGPSGGGWGSDDWGQGPQATGDLSSAGNGRAGEWVVSGAASRGRTDELMAGLDMWDLPPPPPPPNFD
jgi:hypothetical protein